MSIFEDIALLNSTVVHNDSASIAGGAYVNGAKLTIENSIVYFNSATGDGNQVWLSSAELSYTYSDLASGPGDLFVHSSATVTDGGGNVSTDPLFEDLDGPDDDPTTAGDNDYRPGPGSPCVDSADNARVTLDERDLDGDNNRAEPLPFDLAGAPRFVDDAAVPDTGNGGAPIVDMGVFERQ